MANTVDNTFDKIGNTIEKIFGGETISQPSTNGNGGKGSNLEIYGIYARAEQMLKNEWRKDIQYTKALVNSEYMIQTEFKVGGEVEPPTEEQKTDKIQKLKEKKQKLENEIQKLTK